MVQINSSILDNDSYLMIVYGKDRNKVVVEKYNTTINKNSINLLNTPLKSAITNVAMAGYTSPIAQNIASKALPNALLGRINSSIYDIMADGKISCAEVAEDFIGSCTNTLDNMVTDLGFPTPSALYTAIMPNGTGVISKDFANFLAKRTNEENKEAENKANTQQNISVLKLNIVTDDSESLSTSTPSRKTEKGFELITALGNENKTKDFEVVLIHRPDRSLDMYQIKSQLEEIRNLKTPFDVYVNDKDTQNQYKLSNCFFTNLQFKPSGRNSFNCSISIVEMPEWSVDIVKLDTSLSANKSTSASIVGGGNKNTTAKSNNVAKKQGVKQSAKNMANKAKTSNKQFKSKSFPVKRSAQSFIKTQSKLGYSNNKISEECVKHGLHYSPQDIQSFKNKGLI